MKEYQKLAHLIRKSPLKEIILHIIFYNIIRTSSTEPKSDLESLIIKVEKIEDQYLINGS